MKSKLTLCAMLFALFAASPMRAAEEEFDVNFALAANGSSATASSGDAALAIDGNEGTRWESAATDDEWWLLDMGKERIFSLIQIKWEGAYCAEYDLLVSNDGENFTSLYEERSLASAGWQTIKVEKTTARYIKYQGIRRATPWGQSFFEFRVLLPGDPVLTTFSVTAPEGVKVGETADLTINALDQNGAAMTDVEITYTISPEGAATIADGKLTANKKGMISVIAQAGIKSSSFKIFAYEGENLALNQTATAIEGSENPQNAVDGNTGTMWIMPDQEGKNWAYDAWLVVDLGGFYNIDLVLTKFEGACPADYTVDFSEDNTTWQTAYTCLGKEGMREWADLWYGNTIASRKVRYVRVFSTKAATGYGIKVRELEVYGVAFAADDTEKPVLTKAEVAEIGSNFVKLSVAATDNKEVFAFRVKETAAGIDLRLAADADGIIEIGGLEEEKAYTFAVTAIDGSFNESDPKEVKATTKKYYATPQVAAPVPTWPAKQVASLYSDAYEFAPTSLQSYSEGWYLPPTLTQEKIGEDEFLHYNGDMSGMIGWQFAEFMCPTMENFHIDIYPSVSGTLAIGPTTGGQSVETVVAKKTLSVIGGQWNSFDFNLAEDFPTLDLMHIFQFQIVEYGTQTDLCVDNVYFYRTTEYVDTELPTDLKAEAGESGYFTAQVKASAKDNSGVVNYIVKSGDEVLATQGGISGQTVNITVNGLAMGTTYKLSVIAADMADNQTAAVEVEVKTLAGPAAAPAPDKDADKVLSLYSDAYTAATSFNIGGWGQSTLVQEGEVAAGDKVMYLSNTNYLGWELASHIDASAMTNLHLDIYPVSATALSVTPISADPTAEGEYKLTLKAGEWNQFDVPLTSFATVKKGDLFQLKFFNAAPEATATLFLDNVYFWGDGTGLNDLLQDKAATYKVLQDGVIYIIRDGVRYNTLGVQVK